MASLRLLWKRFTLHFTTDVEPVSNDVEPEIINESSSSEYKDDDDVMGFC